MPPQTRATRAAPPASRVYESPQLPQQAKFKPRRQRVYGRHSLGSAKTKRQETLTQIGFVRALSDREIDEEIEAYEREKGGKRRKTVTPSSGLHTQTLTQFDFVATPRVECGDSQEEEESEDEDEDGEGLVKAEEPEYENEDEGGQGPAYDDEPSRSQSEPPAPKRRSRRRGIITVRCIKVEPSRSQSPPAPTAAPSDIRASLARASPHRSAPPPPSFMPPPPKTPTRTRILEIPSSQSPATPLSTQRIPQTPRTRDDRSPLRSRSRISASADLSTQRIPQTPLRGRGERSPLASRGCNRTSPILPTSPIGSKFVPFIQQSQISTQGTTQDIAGAASLVAASSPARLAGGSQATVTATQSPSRQVLSEFTAASAVPSSSSSSSSSSSRPQQRARISKVEIADSDADSDDEELETQEATPRRWGARVLVPSSPAPRDARVASSSPLRRPALAETQGGESQWTVGSQLLLPDSLMGDSLLALPPSLEDWEGE